MKILKTIIVVATLLIGGMAFTGCEDSNASNHQQGATTPEQMEPQAGEKPLDSKEKKAVLDSINIVNNRVDDLITIIESQKSIIERNQSNIDELKKTSSISTLVSWAIALISIILAIYALIKVKSTNARAGRHREDIKQLKHSQIELERTIANSNRNRNSTASTISSRDYSDLSYRISKLERFYAQQQNPAIPAVEIRGSRNVITPQQTIPAQHGYFGLPSQMSMTEAYFKKFDEVRDSDSRFSVEVNGEKAEFKPLLESTKLLNGIKSGDVIKFALEFQGCALSEATQMKVMSAGEAIKKDGLWIITKKAIISLVH